MNSIVLISDVGQGLRAEAFPELGKVEAGGLHRFVGRGKPRAIGGRSFLHFAGATDAPVHGAGRLVHFQADRRAIPGNGPTNGPAVAGAAGAAVNQLDFARWQFARVDQQSRGPTLVGLDGAFAFENAIQRHIQSGSSMRGIHEERTIALG